ncbi:BglII/BstYI family type II restriction endonuclease [Ammoniphilus sp. 3BR4]|uniref:BglII/BstYI family type II restriction endonuclease n=1 Tax=Ammoniphilus sp. 3BR4 TaxID=3158265 RepID=UPI00346582F3
MKKILELKTIEFPYRFADRVINQSIKDEITEALTTPLEGISKVSRPELNSLLKTRLTQMQFEPQPFVFNNSKDMGLRMDFMKQRHGVEVAFSHRSFFGMDVMKFQQASTGEGHIDTGIYIVATSNFQKEMNNRGGKWKSSLTFEQIQRYLTNFQNIIHVPILLVGVDVS